MKKITFLLSILFFMNACQYSAQSKDINATENNSSKIAQKERSKKQLAREIAGLEFKLLKIQDATKAPKLAADLVGKSLLYGEKFPSDSLSEKILFHAGDVARGMGKPKQAIKIWEKISLDYPQATIAAEALFAQGFTADADLKDKNLAAKFYHSFLLKYPKHPYFQQVEQLLSVLEKSPEDLIKEFKKNR